MLVILKDYGVEIALMFVKGGQGTKHYCHHTLLLIRVEIYPVLRLFIL